MADNFESQKNIKASGYTLGICVLLVILFFAISWTLPVQVPPTVEEGIEVLIQRDIRWRPSLLISFFSKRLQNF